MLSCGLLGKAEYPSLQVSNRDTEYEGGEVTKGRKGGGGSTIGCYYQYAVVVPINFFD